MSAFHVLLIVSYLCVFSDAAATQLLQPLTHEPTMLACEAEVYSSTLPP